MENKSKNTALIIGISVSAIVLALGITAVALCFSKLPKASQISDEVSVTVFQPEPVEPQYQFDGLEEWLLEDELLSEDYDPNYVIHFIGIEEDEYTDGEYKYRLHPECGAFLSEYLGSDTVITVPETVGGYTVFGLYDDLFKDRTEITAVTLPDCCAEIGDYVFSGCSSLAEVQLSSGLKYIGKKSFNECISLTDIELPTGLVTVDNGAFYMCENLKNIDFPITMSKINQSAFAYCSSLEEIVIPDRVHTLQAQAFQYCTSLKSVVIGKKVSQIMQDTFYGCTALEDVTIKGKVTEIRYQAFYKTAIAEIELPSSLGEIYDSAFSGCTNLKSITFPEGLHTLGESAFAGCRALESIHLSSTVSFIDDGCFATCLALKEITVDEDNQYFTSVDGVLFTKDMTVLAAYPLARAGEYTVPENVLSIYNRAFRGAFELTSVTLPDTLVAIDPYAFQSSGLTEITIPASVTYIGTKAFNGCEALTEVHIEGTYASIYEDAFAQCPSLEKIYFGGTESQWNFILSSLEDTSMFDGIEIIFNS